MKPYEIATAEHGSEACAALLSEGWEPFAVTVHTDTEPEVVRTAGLYIPTGRHTPTGTFTDYVWFRRRAE